ncbi:MAG: hypothetical protein IPH53_06005 [Flavobacteriales bacterium]|nr:hypothetical protein [Flavobacteriales bacterium]
MRTILFGIASCAGLLSPAQFYFDAPMPIAANISDVERHTWWKSMVMLEQKMRPGVYRSG